MTENVIPNEKADINCNFFEDEKEVLPWNDCMTLVESERLVR